MDKQNNLNVGGLFHWFPKMLIVQFFLKHGYTFSGRTAVSAIKSS